MSVGRSVQTILYLNQEASTMAVPSNYHYNEEGEVPMAPLFQNVYIPRQEGQVVTTLFVPTDVVVFHADNPGAVWTEIEIIAESMN